MKELTALLEKLPDFKVLSRQKRWELNLSPARRAKRRQEKNSRQKKRYREDKAFRDKETARAKKWYDDRGKLLRATR